LRGRRPEPVYYSVSGSGEDGPYAAKKAYGLLIQCEDLVMSTGTVP
jgi:crotonobetainyl-CoA:carnitine CoA-transferase CaiB-like acyl-CoA transferase